MLVVCVCSVCSKLTYQKDGHQYPGRQVVRSTRLRHEEADAEHHRQNKVVDGEPVDDFTSTLDNFNSTTDAEEIVRLCLLLVAWLQLRAGLSRAKANQVLQALGLILNAVAVLFTLIVRASGISGVEFPHFKIPRDIRAVYSRESLNPDFTRTIACPKCFALYPLNDNPGPRKCIWRESPKARICNEPLYKTTRLRSSIKEIPRRLYTTQSLELWLRYFLGRPGIEDLINKSYVHAPNPNMQGFWDSPAARHLGDFRFIQGNLTFALYVDWFNPLTNKIAGKVISCGAIVLYCLNLPHDVCHLPENVFIVGLTPGPNEPDFVTISHILAPLEVTLAQFWTGKVLPTYRHRDGINIRICVCPVIADLVAIRKITGFLSHSATLFCSFCYCKVQDIEDLDMHNWIKRTNEQVREAVQEWKACHTKTGRVAIAQKNGVRWTPLHDLPYWRPVDQLVLGFMHNTLEGILAYHLRDLYGIGRTSAEVNRIRNSEGDGEIFQPEEYSDIDSELEDLLDESQTHDIDLPQFHIWRESQTPISEPPMSTISDDQATIHDLADDDMDIDPADDTYINPPFERAFDFSSSQLATIRACLQNIPLPTYVNRPPVNLGEAGHGKLKANELLIIFTIILPIILPEMWFFNGEATGQAEQLLLDNLYSLVASTNIIASFTTSNEEADAYGYHYLDYRSSAPTIFPNYHSKPNHHYAMHNPDLLKYWGPLAGLSEFPGERLLGMFQHINTNKHMYDMDFTLFQQMCRRSRLDALLQDQTSDGSPLSQLADILDPPSPDISAEGEPLTSEEVAQHLASAPDLSAHDYRNLLDHVRLAEPSCRSYIQPNHPEDALVLPPRAQVHSEIHFRGRTYSHHQSHPGNSAVQFYVHIGSSTKLTGFIETIWQIPFKGILHTFLQIREHQPLQADQEQMAPYVKLPRFHTTIFSAEESGVQHIIDAQQLISHVVAWKRPKGTYGIDIDILVVCCALNRGRN